MSQQFVIVGAGQAGCWVARTLRAEGFSGEIILIGSEAHYPYERPPLSKSVLAGGHGLSTATLLDADQARLLGITCLLGETVVSIDRDARSLLCAGGRRIGYDRLFLTMGAMPRRMDAGPQDASRLHELRTFEDASRLSQALIQGRRLAVLGGGWIGLEVAATARGLGLEVVLIEAGPRLCARSAPPVVSDYLARLHRDRGVELELAREVKTIHADGEGIELLLADGRRIAADHLLVGIGAVPMTQLAQDCGLLVDNGIVVDACGRTGDPAIFAAGDVASQPCRWTGRQMRRESWLNAQNQAIVVAKAALGQSVGHHDLPWLWSDQYGHNIQLLGLPEYGAKAVERADPGEGAGSWLFLNNQDLPIGAVSVNAAKDLRPVRKAIEAGRGLDLAKWADGNTPAQAIPLVDLPAAHP